MEELLLGAVLAGEELDVVDQQGVDADELALELVGGLLLQGAEEGVVELVGAQVQDPRGRIVGTHQVAGGDHQVGLAEAGAAVQQQRIVGAVAGFQRGLPGGGAAELVAAAFDEVVEGVMGIEVALECLAGDSGGARGAGGLWRGLAAAQGADVEADLGLPEMGRQFADPRQVLAAHFLHHEGVGRVQHQLPLATVGLQRLQPGAHVLLWQFGFEALQAAGPDVHGGRDLVGGNGRRHHGRRTGRLWINRGSGSVPPPVAGGHDGTCAGRRRVLPRTMA